ncbi:MAG: hypothetical protein EAZ89_01115 [Bacteroidetes bacterium]|nr:MAG: hypothetical protein EAZ89_01115 [Bacteroidota bacterium]
MKASFLFFLILSFVLHLSAQTFSHEIVAGVNAGMFIRYEHFPYSPQGAYISEKEIPHYPRPGIQFAHIGSLNLGRSFTLSGGAGIRFMQAGFLYRHEAILRVPNLYLFNPKPYPILSSSLSHRETSYLSFQGYLPLGIEVKPFSRKKLGIYLGARGMVQLINLSHYRGSYISYVFTCQGNEITGTQLFEQKEVRGKWETDKPFSLAAEAGVSCYFTPKLGLQVRAVQQLSESWNKSVLRLASLEVSLVMKR